MSSPDLERRAVVELRADGPRIVGHAIVFNTPSRDLGGFREVVRPQAVRAGGDVVALYNHDPAAVLGRTPATLRLETDARGLAFTLDPAPTQAGRDALALVTRGDVTGASFGFTTKKDAWSKDAGGVLRELLDIELAEISLTAFPCYAATDVSIAQRSLQAAKRKHVSDLKPSPSIAWLRMTGALR
jgi:HK97 family phage prohead protease